MYYPIVFFLSPAAVASGAKVKLLPDGTYNIVNPGGVGIQAVNGGVPPEDQTAEVAALEQALAECEAGNPTAPTITGMTVTPNSLPVGGGSVVVDAVVTGTAPVTLSMTLDGVPVPGPIVLPMTVTV